MQKLGADSAVDKVDGESTGEVYDRENGPNVPYTRGDRVHTEGWIQKRRAAAGHGGGD